MFLNPNLNLSQNLSYMNPPKSIFFFALSFYPLIPFCGQICHQKKGPCLIFSISLKNIKSIRIINLETPHSKINFITFFSFSSIM